VGKKTFSVGLISTHSKTAALQRILTRIFYESLAATADMRVLPGVLGCSFDRLRTGGPCDVLFKYASASIFDFGSRISDFLQQLVTQNLIVQISPFVLWFSRSFLLIFNPNSAFRIPQSSTRWHTLLHGLATPIREISGLGMKVGLAGTIVP
jgi:hypothetical protein